jgi:PAS domain S-box-containing protein
VYGPFDFEDFLMANKPTYEELEQKVKGLEKRISEREQEGEVLRERGEQYRTLVESTEDSIYLLNKDGIYQFVNEKHLSRLGCKANRAIGKTYGDFHPLKDTKEFLKKIGEVFETGETTQHEHESHRDNRYFLRTLSPVKNSEGHTTSVTVISKEISESKQTEEALRESENRFRYLSDASMEAIFFTQQGICLEANQIAAEMFGYDDRSEFIGMFGTEMVAPESHEIVKENMLKNLLEPYGAVGERKDGTRFPIAIRAKEMPYKDKGMVRVTSIMDITDRKRAEEALKTAETTYRNIFRNSQIGLFRTDMNTGLILDANNAVAQFIGYKDRNELLAEPFNIAERYVDLKDREEIVSLLKANGEFRNYEARYRRNDGAIIWMRLSARIVPEKGWMEGVSEDITGQKLAEASRLKAEREKEILQAQLHRSQKMEAIGTLAGGVAHDLNNILGGLVSYPELLLLQLPEGSPLRKPILTIQKSGEKAAAVVQDLLTLARRGVVITDVVSLNDVISEYLKSSEHENLQSFHPTVHIETHIEKDTLNILGSSTHLSKTFMNLISNAAEAMPEGGKLTVSTENRYIDKPIRGYDNVKEGDYVVFTISDTGTGISPDDIAKIFEPFYTKKKMGRSGTGLGMAVVWGTVKDHNGYIDVQSTEGRGTTFTLYFPATREKLSEDKSHLAIGSYSGDGESILVIDDVEEQRKIASGMLKELGYSAVSVSSGEEAVEYLKINKIDLLLLDMIMDPGMDGLDTYKKVLELHPGQKAIIASGFSETDRVKELQSLGAGAYIRKPFLLEKIGLAVKEELEK